MGTRESQGPKSPVDRLIEAGLAAYGRGEVDDALVAWEQALALAPEDPRALGYVDYVRQHYELVTGALGEPVAEEDLGVPFGLGDDMGDYEVEITTRRPPAAAAPTDSPTVRLSSPPILDAVDEGWSLEDDPMSRARTIEAPAGLTLEMEADEPPADDFEDRTDEYHRSQLRRQKQPSSPGFLPAAHPTEPPAPDEFPELEHTTGMKERSTGFVQPKDTKERVRSRPELKVTIRTPDDERFDTSADESPHDPEHTASLSLDALPPRALSEGDDALGPALGEELPLEPTAHAPGPVKSKVRTLDFGSKSEGPTKDLGLRSKSQAERDAAERVQAAAERDLRAATELDGAPFARTRTADARAKIVAEVDRNVSGGETDDQRTRRRIGSLIEVAQLAARDLQLERAVLAIDAAFAEAPDSALGHKLIQQNREAIFSVLHDYIGDLDRRPHLAKALHDVVDEPLDSRAAFLLSRVDGTLTFEELLDVSGMPRLEAGRYLCQLMMRGLLAAD